VLTQVDKERQTLRGNESFSIDSRGVGKARNRDIYMLPHLGCEGYYTSFEDSIENARTAIMERIFYHLAPSGVFERPHRPSRDAITAALAGFARRFKRNCHPLTPVPLLDYPYTAYRGQKLQLYLNAANTARTRGVRRSDAYLATFLKHEKIPVTNKRAVPRVIQPRSPVYNVEVGRYLHQLEHVVYDNIAQVFGASTVMKGYNAFEIGGMFHEAWGKYQNPAAFGLDASRFDQHVSPEMLQWEHQQYLRYYKGDRFIERLLSWQLRNVGFVRCHDGNIKYTVSGGRCSGDMNTAMGNCLLMCAMVYGLIEESGLANAGKPTVSLFNNGDDCLIVGERGDVIELRRRSVEYFSKLGFLMKVEQVVDCLEQCSFCQTRPVYDGCRYVMVRELVSLSKDATILERDNATRCLKNQLLSVGECGLSLTSGMPILQSYYNSMVRIAGPGEHVHSRSMLDSGFYRLSIGMHKRVRPVVDAARISFYRAFGVPPDVQLYAEAYYDGLKEMYVPGLDQQSLPVLGPAWW